MQAFTKRRSTPERAADSESAVHEDVVGLPAVQILPKLGVLGLHFIPLAISVSWGDVPVDGSMAHATGDAAWPLLALNSRSDIHDTVTSIGKSVEYR